jgi:hypothetical protein
VIPRRLPALQELGRHLLHFDVVHRTCSPSKTPDTYTSASD